MTDIVVHIGLNKTGTSSIQDFMSMNADALLERGICYPRAGRELTAHHPLSYWLKKLPEDADPRALEPGIALLDEIRACGARRVVLSSEDFHTHGPRGVRHLARLLEGHDVRIVLYLREHLAYLASWYQQNVQASHLSAAFDTFCYFARTPFHVTAERWTQAFGNDALELRLYDRERLVERDIVRDFADAADLRVGLQGLQRKPFDSNPSVAGNVLFAKRLINNFLDKRAAAALNDDITALSRLVPEFRGAMHVNETVVNYVGSLYAADRAKLQKRHGLAIVPSGGARDGSLTPDLRTLSGDWEMLRREAEKRSLPIARELAMLSLGDLGSLLPAS